MAEDEGLLSKSFVDCAMQISHHLAEVFFTDTSKPEVSPDLIPGMLAILKEWSDK